MKPIQKINPIPVQSVPSVIPGQSGTVVIIVIAVLVVVAIVVVGIYLSKEDDPSCDPGSAKCSYESELNCEASDICMWDTKCAFCTDVVSIDVIDVSYMDTVENTFQTDRCDVNEYVSSDHECVPCAGTSTNSSGDDPTGDPTSCRKIPCMENHHVFGGECTPCPEGSIRDAGDDPHITETSCLRSVCKDYEKLVCDEPGVFSLARTMALSGGAGEEKCGDPGGNEETGFRLDEDITAWVRDCNMNGGTPGELGGCEGMGSLCTADVVYGDDDGNADFRGCIPNYLGFDPCTGYTEGSKSSCDERPLSPYCTFTPATPLPTQCRCEACGVGMEHTVRHTVTPDDENAYAASGGRCVPEGTGVSAYSKCQNTERVVQINGQSKCEACADFQQYEEDGSYIAVPTYGCPILFGNPNNQPGETCEHTLSPKEVDALGRQSYNGDECRRPICKETEKLVKNEITPSGQFLRNDGNPSQHPFECVSCGTDVTVSTQDVKVSTKDHTISPDLMLQINNTHVTTCTFPAGSGFIDALEGICLANEATKNENWKYDDWNEWQGTVYNDPDNDYSWLPGRVGLAGRAARGENATNYEVYYPESGVRDSEEGKKYTYSYISKVTGDWIHLCDCSENNVDNAHHHNGFTNCKCGQNQTIDTGSGRCTNITYSCYANKNKYIADHILGPEWTDGEFWNIMDPWCTFKGQEALSSTEVKNRCCTKCQHKVYSHGAQAAAGGVRDAAGRTTGAQHSQIKPPPYAKNWNTPEPYGEHLTELSFNRSDDPIFKGVTTSITVPDPDTDRSPTGTAYERTDYRSPATSLALRTAGSNGLSFGFNSRPSWFYPVFTDDSDMDSNGFPRLPGTRPLHRSAGLDRVNETATGTRIDFDKSKNALKDGVPPGSLPENAGSTTTGLGKLLTYDSTCTGPTGVCDYKGIHRIATTNLFTCKRTNVKETNYADTSLEIPEYGVVGDEKFYGLRGTSESAEAPLYNRQPTHLDEDVVVELSGAPARDGRGVDLDTGQASSFPGRGWINKETSDLVYSRSGHYSDVINANNSSRGNFCSKTVVNGGTHITGLCDASYLYFKGIKYPCKGEIQFVNSGSWTTSARSDAVCTPDARLWEDRNAFHNQQPSNLNEIWR